MRSIAHNFVKQRPSISMFMDTFIEMKDLKYLFKYAHTKDQYMCVFLPKCLRQKKKQL